MNRLPRHGALCNFSWPGFGEPSLRPDLLLLLEIPAQHLNSQFFLLDATYSLGALSSFFVFGKESRDSEKVHFPFKYHESYEYISPKLPK